MLAFTTNVEFGYWLHTNKVIYGRPDDSEHIMYLDWLYKLDYNKSPINNLEELIKIAISEVEERKNMNINVKLKNKSSIKKVKRNSSI